MKIRIQNDGGPGYMTQLTNAETGETIEHATGVEVNLVIGVRDMPKATITTIAPVVDVITDAEIRQVCALCGKPTKQTPDSAMDVLVAFAEYANRIERETRGKQVPTLKLYSDNSGRIHDEKADMLYIEFDDILDLMDKLMRTNDNL